MVARARRILQIALVVAAVVVLALIFPRTLAFAERAARELRYFWWAILLLALGIWLVWGFGRRPKEPGDLDRQG